MYLIVRIICFSQSAIKFVKKLILVYDIFYGKVQNIHVKFAQLLFQYVKFKNYHFSPLISHMLQY